MTSEMCIFIDLDIQSFKHTTTMTTKLALGCFNSNSYHVFNELNIRKCTNELFLPFEKNYTVSTAFK